MLWIILALILLAAAAYLMYYGYKLAFYYSDPQAPAMEYNADDQCAPCKGVLDPAIIAFDSQPCERVSIRSRDGLTLQGRYYHSADGAPLHILCHGYKGNAIRDFCGGWKVAAELGHNALLIDQRCHGKSQGHTITFGIREKTDVLEWIRYANGRFGNVPIVLSGVSMGAATVLMAAGMELPENVKAVVADCPYDAPSNIIRKVLGQDMGMPEKMVYPLIRLGGMVYGGFNLDADSPVEAVKRSRVPILLIHGDEDRFVPYAMSQNIHAAAPEKIRFVTVPGAGHALNFATNPQLYSQTLKTFLSEHLQ